MWTVEDEMVLSIHFLTPATRGPCWGQLRSQRCRIAKSRHEGGKRPDTQYPALTTSSVTIEQLGPDHNCNHNHAHLLHLMFLTYQCQYAADQQVDAINTILILKVDKRGGTRGQPRRLRNTTCRLSLSGRQLQDERRRMCMTNF